MKGSKKMLRLTALGLLSILCTQAYAAGFKLEMQSVSTLADAGDAAVVEDAGTNWYNSAGLTYLPAQLVWSGIEVYQATKFSGNTFAPARPLSASFFGSGHASSHTGTFLPSFHATYPFWDRYAVGLSITPAWGLVEDYGENSIVRYNLTRIYTRTLMVSPSLAYKINDRWSIGAGPDFHYMYVSSKSKSRTQPITTTDSISRFSANSWNYGGHIGLLYIIDQATRIGLNYRTQIVQDLEGYSDFQLGAPIGTGFETNSFRLPLNLPPSTTLSLYRDVNPNWAIMGTIAYDQWGVLKNFHARNVVTPTGVLPDVNSPQKMSNALDVGVGTKFRYNDRWTLRGSLKYIGSPTNDAYRDVNFPDASKLGINLGTHYQMNKALAFDFILAHVFALTVPINGVNPITGATATGKSRASIDLAGAQIVWTI